MMNVDLSLNQEIKYIIPAACFLTPLPPSPWQDNGTYIWK